MCQDLRDPIRFRSADSKEVHSRSMSEDRLCDIGDAVLPAVFVFVVFCLNEIVAGHQATEACEECTQQVGLAMGVADKSLASTD